MSDIQLHHGDCLDVLRTLPDCSVDAVVTDPPYGLEFMGKEWDGADGFRRSLNGNDAGRDNPFGRTSRTSPEYRAGRVFQEWSEAWARECLRVLKPGGHLLAFGGTRTWHRLACAVEDAGFEIRDSIAWMTGSGFPKSLNASKAMKESGRVCTCPEPSTQHDLPHLRDTDVPQAEGAPRGSGAVLLAPMPEPGAPIDGAATLGGHAGSEEPGMEGRRDLQAGEGQLRRPEVRPVPAGVPADGASGRLHHGAPPSDGSVGGAAAAPLGSGEPHQPRSAGQPARESGALPVERGPQAWGGWPLCARCSQPIVPDGLGTALKPAHEPVVLARKPLAGTVSANVLAWGTGALNIDGCRVGEMTAKEVARSGKSTSGMFGLGECDWKRDGKEPAGRWPANVILDEHSARELDEMSGERPGAVSNGSKTTEGMNGTSTFKIHEREQTPGRGDTGGASRFFFIAREDSACSDDSFDTGDEPTSRPIEGHTPTAERSTPAPIAADLACDSRFIYTPKADASERVRVNGTAHPTVKPLALMRWLVRLVTPPGGTVLEPFAGSGTTVEACLLEGFNCIAIEREADYLPLIQQRINRRRDPVEAIRATGDDGGLFDLLNEEPA